MNRLAAALIAYAANDLLSGRDTQVEIVELASIAIFVLKFPEHPFSDQIKKVADRILKLQ